jgi:leader peptidase (prepilin peptidase)/N-methyltransferase
MLLECILIFVAGLILGSFLNICISRIPLDRPVLSKAPDCSRRGTRWGRRVLVEVVTGALLVTIFLRFGLTFEFPAYSALMMILTVVFFIDINHRIIPDKLVIAGLAAGFAAFAVSMIFPWGFEYDGGKWWSTVAAMILLPLMLLLVALAGMLVLKTNDAMGMGDVKLLAPIGLFLGLKTGLTALVISVVLAGVASAALIIFKRKGKRDTIPFGPYIVAGTYISFMWGSQILRWYMGGL